jgi:hypothetical protein
MTRGVYAALERKQDVAPRYDTELMELICNENNRDVERLPSGSAR